MSSAVHAWLKKVYHTRLITAGLKNDLLQIDKLYTGISQRKHEIYNCRKVVDLEYVSLGGDVKCKDEEAKKTLEEKETKLTYEIDKLRRSVDGIIEQRTKLISSEIAQWKSKRGGDYLSKPKLKRQKRGSLLIVGELKHTMRLYLNLVKERETLHYADLETSIHRARVHEDNLTYKNERQRDRNNLHNFTAKDITSEERQILNCGGGFVMKTMHKMNNRKKQRAVKRQTEFAILQYVEHLAGNRKKRGGLPERGLNLNRKVNARKGIMRYYFHPRIGYLERRFINKALKLVDFSCLNFMGRNCSLNKTINRKAIKRRESQQKGLKLLRKLTQNDDFVLRESDKNLGWSLNSASWYKQGYNRHLHSGFYQRVGRMEDANTAKCSTYCSIANSVCLFTARCFFLLFILCIVFITNPPPQFRICLSSDVISLAVKLCRLFLSLCLSFLYVKLSSCTLALCIDVSRSA